MPITKEAAAQYLYDNVQVPVFFDRLQSHWNIKPANAAEMQVMLKTAANLMLLKDAEQQQQTAAGGSFLQKAAALVEQQVQAVYPNAFDPLPQIIKQSAKATSANPEFVEACLALQA